MAAAAAPSNTVTDRRTASPPDIQRKLLLFSLHTHPLSSGEGIATSGLTNPFPSFICKENVNDSKSSQGHKITKITKSASWTISHSFTRVTLITVRDVVNAEVLLPLD
ncbi:hypothetical protein ACF052_32665 [Streptomyces pilosus]|uniref:hypothetical protein n=1 Tax=Streptomyces pilosus TaxID=28893 RepID=UPI0037020CEC